MYVSIYKKVFLCLAFSVLFLMGAYGYAGESCAGEEVNVNTLDVQYHYLGDHTQQGDSMLDLLIMNKPSAKDDKGDVYSSKQKRALIMHFCDVILRTRDDKNMQWGCFDNGDFRYDPRQSLFVYALCVNMDDKGGGRKIAGTTFPKRDFRSTAFQNIQYVGANTPFNLVKYIDKETDKDLNSVRGLPPQDDLDAGISHDSCNPKTSMQGCDVTRFLPHIFNEVMNIYSNMKLASIYGFKYVNLDEDAEQQRLARKKAIEDFSHAYFSSPSKTNQKDDNNECNAKGAFYLNNESLKGDKAHCLHEKVYNILDGTLKSLQNLLRRITYVKADTIFATHCEGYKTNILACAFSSTGSRFTNNDRTAFQNLYMNELMRYTLFVTYYQGKISNSPETNPLQITDYSAVVKRNQREIQQLMKEIVFAKEAMYQTMRRLQLLYTSFPIHIGLMAYLEDLSQYRATLAKIYTPVQQLSSLWPNAQACE